MQNPKKSKSLKGFSYIFICISKNLNPSLVIKMNFFFGLILVPDFYIKFENSITKQRQKHNNTRIEIEIFL